MPFTVKDILFGGVVPMLVAISVRLLARLVVKSPDNDRWSAALAILLGFVSGYGLLSLAPWIPTAHWHWLPYALLAATIFGAVSCADGITSIERTLLYFLIAIVAGWFLIPDWSDLAPSRRMHITVFTVFVTVEATLLHLLAKRLTGVALPAVLWATVSAASVVLALSGSLRFAQVAIAMAAPLFGLTIIAIFDRDSKPLVGTSLVFSLGVIGFLLVGRVNSFSEVPLASYVLIPIAPLLVSIERIPSVSRLSAGKRFFAVAALPIVLLCVAVAMAVMAESNDEWSESPNHDWHCSRSGTTEFVPTSLQSVDG